MKWQKQPSFAILAALEATAIDQLATEPNSPGCWISLISLQKRMGLVEQAHANLDRVAATLSSDIESRCALLDVFLALGEHRRALAIAQRLVVERPKDRVLREKLGRAIARTDRWGEVQQNALALLDSSAPVGLSLNQCWQTAEGVADIEAIADRCRARLAANPIDTDARCFLAHALAFLGRDEEARATMALDTLVQITSLPTPASHMSSEAFHSALIGEILVNRTLERDPTDKATRDGLQTASLGQAGEAAISTLVAEIKTAVGAYVEALAGSADPIIVSAPDAVRINQWAVVYDGTGHQTAHRHPSGWLSGVYYVAAPADPEHGALLLGAPQKNIADPPWGIRRVQPIPGRLALFPSFVSHATEPCGMDGERICVAFDIMPASDPW